MRNSYHRTRNRRGAARLKKLGHHDEKETEKSETLRNRCQSIRNKRGAAHLSEFGAVLAAIAIFIAIPLLFTVLALCGAGLISLYTEHALTEASEAATYNGAIAAIRANESFLRRATWSPFLRVRLSNKPHAMSLYAIASDKMNRVVAITSPNSDYVPAKQSSEMSFVFRLDTTFEVAPITQLKTNIPLLSQPLRFTLVETRAVEHPDFTFRT